MNLKPFNVEEALANPDRVVTRDGKKVTQLTKFEIDNPFCLIGVVDYKIKTWKEKGNFINKIENKHDLFLLPQTKKMYIVIAADIYHSTRAFEFWTEESAKNFIAEKKFVAYSKITPIEIEI